MAQTKEMVSGTFRVDKSIKESAERALQNMGMNLSTGINIFLAQVAREQVLPFRPGEHTHSPAPNSRLDLALRESEEILEHPEQAQAYTSFEELWADI